MKSFIRFAVIVLCFSGLSTVLSGCWTYRTSDWHMMTTKDLDFENTKYIRKDIVEGEDRTLSWPIQWGRALYTTACENALLKSNGQFLTNVSITEHYDNYVLFALDRVTVRGHVWVEASASDLEGGKLSEVYELRQTVEGLALVNVQDFSDIEFVVTEDNFEDLVEVKREY